MKENSNKFDINSGCIRQDILLKYLKGELSGKERNLVERHLLECEMCSDELEGLSNLLEPERVAELERELGNLSKEQRVCVELFYLKDKCYQEVAEITGYSLNQVKSYIQNGKRNLIISMVGNAGKQ